MNSAAGDLPPQSCLYKDTQAMSLFLLVQSNMNGVPPGGKFHSVFALHAELKRPQICALLLKKNVLMPVHGATIPKGFHAPSQACRQAM
eukprot:3604925-Rhodomonas_salina.2